MTVLVFEGEGGVRVRPRFVNFANSKKAQITQSACIIRLLIDVYFLFLNDPEEDAGLDFFFSGPLSSLPWWCVQV
jgi:hypothetical protein